MDSVFSRLFVFDHIDSVTAKNRTDGAIWLGHHRGVTRLPGNEATTYAPRHGLPDKTVVGMNRDGNGRLWLCTPNGAACFDEKTLAIYTKEDGL